jgi:hypothetical protein
MGHRSIIILWQRKEAAYVPTLVHREYNEERFLFWKIGLIGANLNYIQPVDLESR